MLYLVEEHQKLQKVQPQVRVHVHIMDCWLVPNAIVILVLVEVHVAKDHTVKKIYFFFI